MTNPLTDEKLGEWEALATAATPGEWRVNGPANDLLIEVCTDDYAICDVFDDLTPAELPGDANAAHIAFNNPAFALSAIAEIRRLREREDQARGHVRRLADWIEHEVGADLPYAEGEQDARAFLNQESGG